MYRITRLIHRIAGIIGAILMLIMAITGLLLNHRSFIGYSSEVDTRLKRGNDE